MFFTFEYESKEILVSTDIELFFAVGSIGADISHEMMIIFFKHSKVYTDLNLQPVIQFQ